MQKLHEQLPRSEALENAITFEAVRPIARWDSALGGIVIHQKEIPSGELT